MNPVLLALLGLLGTGSVITVVITKVFDLKIEKIKAEREVETTKIVAEASILETEGKEAIQTIVALNHILIAENERLTKALKECNDRSPIGTS